MPSSGITINAFPTRTSPAPDVDDPRSRDVPRRQAPEVELVDDENLFSDPGLVQDLAALVLAEEGIGDGTEVSITAVTEEVIAELNARHLGRSGPTDVLSFPLVPLSPGTPPHSDPAGPPLLLGDVVVSPSYVARQAAELGVDPEDEMALMVCHGILHLLGYDHVDDADAERMEERERRLLALVGRERR